MSIIAILETLVIGPLKLLFEIIFQLSNLVIQHPGLSIISLSLIMNILVLPLYKRADDMQEEARNIEKKLHDGVAHIKKTFSGDERMMILQAYYRQNNYKPTDALKGSVSLLLQIPFFMAAYNFLSNLADLQGATLGPIKDLSTPDGLIVIGGFAINLLPILMTLINVISSAIYLKGFPVKTKVQIYGMALFFLVFLYTSPSGLVFYWTLNNVFSLGKTIYYKIKNPQLVLRILISLSGIAALVFGLFFYRETGARKILVIAFGIAIQFVWLIPVVKSFLNKRVKSAEAKPNKKLFVAGSLFLTVLVGGLISSTLIAASPQEFVDITFFYNPLWYILSTFCLAAGTFLIWMRVFYWLATPKVKVAFERGVWILSIVMIVNYMFFGSKLGNISATLQYDNGMYFTITEYVVNTLVILAIGVILYFIVKKWGKLVTSVLLISALAMSVMCVVNVFSIKKSVDSINISDASKTPHFELSKTGQNVVVIMLDRAIGEYVPYILNEKPELKEQFDGFTYYSNTISFGSKTNFGSPPLLGGYEYTPVEMNKRDTQTLASKHNEALLVMPVIFSQNGYDVTMCDPTYANYNWIPDLSLFDDYPDIDAYITKGMFIDDNQKQDSIEGNHRNFFCFSFMKCMPLGLQPAIYSNGSYRRTNTVGQISYSNQIMSGKSQAKGYSKSFMNTYSSLTNMSTMSVISEDKKNTFMFISNDVTHDTSLLQTPNYTPAYEIDNTKYDAEHTGRFTLEDGRTLTVSSSVQMQHYHSNMVAFIEIGKWLDYLKANDVYDNTKIIIVSDHGQTLHQSKEMEFTDPAFYDTSAQNYFPLLLVKDFNNKGFTVSDEFMTNADVPTLAFNGLIKNPVNPFTGKPINSDEKYAHDQYIIVSMDWDITENNGNTFLPARWVSVSGNLWNKDSWRFYNNNTVLKEHKFPQ
mgnify:CR=1 FL=1